MDGDGGRGAGVGLLLRIGPENEIIERICSGAQWELRNEGPQGQESMEMDENIKAGGTVGEAFSGGDAQEAAVPVQGEAAGVPAPESFGGTAAAACVPETEVYGSMAGGPAPGGFGSVAGGPVPEAYGGAEAAGMPESSDPAMGVFEGTAVGGAVPGAFGEAAAGPMSATAEAAAGGSEAGTSATEEAAPDPSKGKNTKGKVLGCLEMVAAVGLAVFGGWMFWQTRGTRLLYVDVVFGRICRYYWIAFVGALVFFAVGLYTLKRARKGAGKSARKRSRKEVEKDGKLE